jgi:hypothetical protein
MEGITVEGDNSPRKAARQVLVGPVPPIDANLSPDAFHIYATHYYKCKQDFKPPDKYFSPIPYFLLCRAIELEFKARHLKGLSRSKVKDKFGHNLLKAYNELDAREQILSQSEFAVLTTADELYRKTDLAYFNPEHALTAFSRYPDLQTLDTIAKKLIDSGSTSWL